MTSSFFDRFVERLKTLSILRKIYALPGVAETYHYTLSFLAAAIYRFPSERMTIIGVTGTKGKTTTCNLIAQIMNSAGIKTGMVTTANIRIGEEERVNDTKQTMLGRLDLQRLLREMVDAGCVCAVVETSSEGILQYRHKFISYDVAVFTNVSPEHIERHGSFENYRASKLELFKQVAEDPNGIGVYNFDDPDAKYFLAPKMRKQYGYAWKSQIKDFGVYGYQITEVELGIDGTSFVMNKEKFETRLLGEFNVYNAAAAICSTISQGVKIPQIQDALKNILPAPGRFELVDRGQDFTVIVDYAHEPASLEAAYKTTQLFYPKRTIGVLGSQGGGRDKWKRPAMARVADQYCDTVILTNEDPYDEDPKKIIADMKAGAPDSNKIVEIIDRREAIKKAISLAQKGDVVIITGKGGEVWMCVENGKKIAWSDRAVVEEILNTG